VLLGLGASLTVAQKAQLPQDVWLVRAQNFTDDSLKDVDSLEPLDGAVVLGQLGAQWWNADPKQARKWLLKAVETVELEPAKESSAERRKRLAAARSLVSVISTTDQTLWDRLQVVLTSRATLSADADRNTTADAFVDAALLVLKNDPGRAASLGSAALQVGLPTSLQHLLWGLRGRDAGLADGLFSQALAVARATSDGNFLNSLRYAAFPELPGTGYDVAAAPSGAIRKEMLLILADHLQQRTAALASNGIRDCGLAPALVDGLQTYFDKLQPQRADLVRQIVRNCQTSLAHSSGTETEPESIAILQTVDSLLAEADRTPDKKIKRPAYLAQAARLAANQKNFAAALKILDSMSDEERKFIGIWETWRRDWAVALAVQFMKRDDVGGMQQVIKAVPDSLRPFAKIYFVDKLPKESYTQIARDFLDEARKDLANSETPDLEKADWYLLMVRLYCKFHSDTKAGEAFKDAIGSLNRAKSAEPTKPGSLSEDFTAKIVQADFPISLLESYPSLINEVVLSMTTVSKRARVRLDLVQISLKQYRALAAKSTPERKDSSMEPK
jgi:hypothetical protein